MGKSQQKINAKIIKNSQITLPFNFKPRSYQLKVLKALDRGAKRVCAVWHRRAGKDKTILNWVIKKCYLETMTCWYCFPNYSQAKKAVWNNIDKAGIRFRDHFPREIVKRVDNQQMLVELVNGSIIQLIGTDDVDKLVGAAPKILVYSEYALQDPDAFKYLLPILRENNGIAIFISTPRGKNHLFDLFERFKSLQEEGNEEYYAELLTVEDTYDSDGNPIVTSEMIKEDQETYGLSDEEIAQEYFCSFQGVNDESYYGKILEEIEQNDHIGTFPYNPIYPVSTAWDLGVKDATTIWFYQTIQGRVHLIDYYAKNNEGLPHFMQVINERGYFYDNHYAPFDIGVREWGSGHNRVEQAKKLGLNFKRVPQVPRSDGIRSVRSFLKICFFDKEKCKNGLHALHSYRREWDSKNKVYKDSPVHDWASDGADSFRYLVVSHSFNSAKHEPENKQQPARTLLPGSKLDWLGY